MYQKTFVKGFHNETDVGKMIYRQLGATDLMVSFVSLGGCAMGDIYGVCHEATAIAMIKLAILNGINYIDTAPYYGQGRSEEIIGKALNNIPRAAYYIGTKVGRYENDVNKMFDFSAKTVEDGFNDSLRRLKLDYVDIIQVHDVEFCEDPDIIINETLPALKKIVESGKARYIGITGYSLSVLKHIYEKSTVKISSILSYCRYTLIDDELTNYIAFFKENNIGIINGSILSMGLLTLGGPQCWHPSPTEIKSLCLEATSYSKQKGYDIADLATKFSFGLFDVSTHLVGASDSDMLRRNLLSSLSPVTDDEKQLIKDIREKFFKNLKQKHWEGLEIEKFKREKTKSN